MSGDFELKIINKPVYYIELVSLLNRVAEDRGYLQLSFDEEQSALLDIVKGLRLQGLELFELYLRQPRPENIHELEKLLQGYTPLEFLTVFFDEELSKEAVLQCMEKDDFIKELLKKNKYWGANKAESLIFLFQSTEKFIGSLISIFRLLEGTVRQQLEDLAAYEEGLSKVKGLLKAKTPLDTAQELMGKKFGRVYDFDTYYFVPSYFYKNKPMRTFDHHTQILVHPIQQADEYDKVLLVNALKVIGDDTRLEIIRKLAQRPMFGKELAQELGLVTSTVSHHLEQLRSIGLLHEERDKSLKYFSLNRNEYDRLWDEMKNFIREKS